MSEWEEIKKPNPEIFHRAIKKLGVLANECIFMGDHPDNDVKAAQNVGMKGFWKKDYQWNDVDADFIINDLSEVTTIINNLNKQPI